MVDLDQNLNESRPASEGSDPSPATDQVALWLQRTVVIMLGTGLTYAACATDLYERANTNLGLRLGFLVAALGLTAGIICPIIRAEHNRENPPERPDARQGSAKPCTLLRALDHNRV